MPLFGSFAGNSARTLGLTSGAPPGPPSITSSSSTATTYTINFTPVLGSFDIARFEYSLNGGAFTGSISSSATSHTVTGLVPSTAYTLQIRAVDTAGQISDGSNVDSRSTTAEIAPSAPSVTVTQLESTGTPSNATKLQWSFGTAAAGTYPVAYYQYRVRTSSSTIQDWTTTPMGVGVNNTYTGLSVSTQYYFDVRGVATSNGTTYGSIGTGNATTDTEITNSAPSVTIDSVTTTNVTFTRGTSSGGTYGVSSYSWSIYNSLSQLTNSGTMTTSVSSVTVSAGVGPNETFTVYVSAVSLTSGTSGSSGSASGQLNPLTPSAPTLSFSSTNASERANAYLSWNAVTYATGYKVYRNGVEVADTTSTTRTVGVSENTSYSFTVKAYNRLSNLSASSNTKSMTVGWSAAPWSVTDSRTIYLQNQGSCSNPDLMRLNCSVGSVTTDSSSAGYKYIYTIQHEASKVNAYSFNYTIGDGTRYAYWTTDGTQPAGWTFNSYITPKAPVSEGSWITQSVGVYLGGSDINNATFRLTTLGYAGWNSFDASCNPNLIGTIYVRNLKIDGYQITASTYS